MSHKYRVLFVDDEEKARKLITQILEDDYDVSVASSVLDAMKIIGKSFAQGNPPEIILTDIKMPGDDGIALVKKAREYLPSSPIIFITGHADKIIALEAVRVGAFDLIEKPFQDDELLSSLLRAITQIENRKKLYKNLEKSAEEERLIEASLATEKISQEIRGPVDRIDKNLSNVVLKVSPEISKEIEECAAEVRQVKNLLNYKNQYREEMGEKVLAGTFFEILSESIRQHRERFNTYGISFLSTEIPKEIKTNCHVASIIQVVSELLKNAERNITPIELRWVRLEFLVKNDGVEIVVQDSSKRMGEALFNKDREDLSKHLGRSCAVTRRYNGNLMLDLGSDYNKIIAVFKNG